MASTHLVSIYEASAVLAPVSCTLVYLPHQLSSCVLIADISVNVRNAFTNSSSFVDALQTCAGYISSCTFFLNKIDKKIISSKKEVLLYGCDYSKINVMLFQQTTFYHAIKETI